MPNLTSVTLTAGVPTAGTGTVGTLDNVTGTAGAPSVPVLTVQGVSGGTAMKVDGSAVTQPVSIASLPSGAVTNAGTFAVQADSSLAQASTTSGQKGVLAQGAVTTSAPTYTTAQTSPLSLDTAGNLRVNVVAGGGSGGTSSTVGSAAPSVATAVGFTDGTNLALGKVRANGTGPAVSTDPAVVVTLRDVNANGRALPSASAPVVLNSMTYKSVAASASATLLGATGASGDYLDGVLIVPATAAAGAVSITDGSGSAITIFAGGGTTALPTLAPFYVPIGAISSGGAGGWKVTTGTNVSVIGVGNFT